MNKRIIHYKKWDGKENKIPLKTKLPSAQSFFKTNMICTINYNYISSKSKISLIKEDKKPIYRLIDTFFDE